MRCFIGIEIPDENKMEQFFFNLQKRYSFNLRLVKKENYHITLHFLGEINRERFESLKEEMGKIDKSLINFKLRFKDFGIFPGWMSPKILWAGFEDTTGNLLKVHKILKEIISRYGIEVDRREFTPHLTVARFKNFKREEEAKLKEMFEELKNFSKDLKKEITIKELILYESHLKPEGPIYKKLFVISR